MAEPDPNAAAGDPSMEDILASIRRILADGEAPESDGAAPHDHAGVVPAANAADGHVADGHAAGGHAPPDEDVFVLDHTMLIEERTPMQNEPRDSSFAEHAQAEHVPAAHIAAEHVAAEPVAAEHAYADHRTAPGAAAEADYSHLDAGEKPAEPLLNASVAAATSASLGALVRVVHQRQTQVYRNGPTIEDLVREEIRPVLKSWLDENLAPMVERLVRAEIDRVTGLKG